ncbi:MAG: addiction module protein [Elusimicrobiota bacterium]
MIKTNKFFTEAISLPIEIRTQLIDRLLKSINPAQKEIDELWAIEAERRVQEIKNGDVKLVHGKDVFRRIYNRLKK